MQNKRKTWRWGAIIAALAVFAVMFVPVPYVVESPGPTFDVLDSEGAAPVISVQGAKTYSTTGELHMVTVSLQGGPQNPLTVGQALLALVLPSWDLSPQEDVFPKELTGAQIEKISRAQMEGSQQNAEAAALENLGYKVPAKFFVAGVSKNAQGKLQAGDQIVALEAAGRKATTDTAGSLFRFLAKTPPKTDVKVRVVRHGHPQDVTVKSQKMPARRGSVLGIAIDPKVKLPVDVKISLAGVGGPSAGTMFALGIIDKLTPKQLAGNQVIAGTGAIRMDGEVEAISGVPQKMVGAKADGAKFFLVPRSNCEDALGRIPSGLRVVPIQTLQDARTAVEKIGAGQSDLPSCPAKK
ncbi:MAG: S16 family serine protease [Actinomycetaceae bacterium]|nr:S16 family serine protease [Actinomycetaceae bacterium]